MAKQTERVWIWYVSERNKSRDFIAYMEKIEDDIRKNKVSVDDLIVSLSYARFMELARGIKSDLSNALRLPWTKHKKTIEKILKTFTTMTPEEFENRKSYLTSWELPVKPVVPEPPKKEPKPPKVPKPLKEPKHPSAPAPSLAGKERERGWGKKGPKIDPKLKELLDLANAMKAGLDTMKAWNEESQKLEKALKEQSDALDAQIKALEDAQKEAS